MPPVDPKQARKLVQGAFAVLSTAFDFLSDKQDGLGTVEAVERAARRLRKRSGQKKTNDPRPTTNEKEREPVYVEVVEAKVVQ